MAKLSSVIRISFSEHGHVENLISLLAVGLTRPLLPPLTITEGRRPSKRVAHTCRSRDVDTHVDRLHGRSTVLLLQR